MSEATSHQEAYPAPPHPLHDPNDRVLVGCHGPWEVRVHARNSARHHYFAPRGFLHVQFWHPERGISVLTQSALTAGRFEVCSPGRRLRPCCPKHLQNALASMDVLPLCMRLIRSYEGWLVHAPAIGATCAQKASR